MLFKRPFAIAHGTRYGTDAVFVRIEYLEVVGYGEVSLPPYMPATVTEVCRILAEWSRRYSGIEVPMDRMMHLDMLDAHPAARNVLSMALNDLLAKLENVPVNEYFKLGVGDPATLVTLGIGPADDLPERLAELPVSKALKVKLGGPEDEEVLRTLAMRDPRSLFLDANQAFTDVGQAIRAVEAAGRERVLGLEQPFPPERYDLYKDLRARSSVRVFADESVQEQADLLRWLDVVDGVNIKLMKCGGLDRALDLARTVRGSGRSVMLGSMSESSLGCTAMAHLAGLAEIVDLDGPWLLKNDPFRGIGMDEQGNLILPQGCGIGAIMSQALEFVPIGA
ncbi:MAG: hypothetical protein H6594_03080 [Flavobacteriales bacterium]|nr:hypothetical protein [Flavobacteriales bacterium]